MINSELLKRISGKLITVLFDFQQHIRVFLNKAPYSVPRIFLAEQSQNPNGFSRKFRTQFLSFCPSQNVLTFMLANRPVTITSGSYNIFFPSNQQYLLQEWPFLSAWLKVSLKTVKTIDKIKMKPTYLKIYYSRVIVKNKIQ